MLLARSLLVLVLATPLLSADVLVVDAAGGGDFTTLTAAVAAAVDGDTILVHDGEYVEEAPVVIDGKAIAVVGEWSASVFDVGVTIRPGLIVTGLPPAEQVVLQNLVIFGADGTSTAAPLPALALSDNDTHVRVQSCWLIGGTGADNSHPDGVAAVAITDSYSTALVGCIVFGGSGQFSPSLSVVAGSGGPGVALDVGQVAVSACDVRGGWGGGNIPGGWAQGGDGGAGLAQLSGGVLVAGSGLQGGDGGTSHFGGDGGPGLAMGGPGFALLMGGSFGSGGDGGGSDVGPNGLHGVGVFDPGGQVTDFGGTQHGFDVTSPLREGQVGSLLFDGDSTDKALLFVSLSLHQIALPGYQGVLLLAPNALLGPFVIGPPGNLQIPFVAPSLPAALESLRIYIQPAYAGTGGTDLGTGRVLTLLDASF
jgi:hypothetical protein